MVTDLSLVPCLYTSVDPLWIETVDEMLGIAPANNPRSILDGLHWFQGPPGFIPIACSGYGDYTAISVREQDYGHVFYFFHEIYDPTKGFESEGVYHLSDSFSGWIESLECLSEED